MGNIAQLRESAKPVPAVDNSPVSATLPLPRCLVIEPLPPMRILAAYTFLVLETGELIQSEMFFDEQHDIVEWRRIDPAYELRGSLRMFAMACFKQVRSLTAQLGLGTPWGGKVTS